MDTTLPRLKAMKLLSPTSPLVQIAGTEVKADAYPSLDGDLRSALATAEFAARGVDEDRTYRGCPFPHTFKAGAWLPPCAS